MFKLYFGYDAIKYYRVLSNYEKNLGLKYCSLVFIANIHAKTLIEVVLRTVYF